MSLSTPPVDTANRTLIERVAAGDERSWELLTKIYCPLVFRWARKSGVPEDLCADIAQEVFLTVFRSLDVDRVGRLRHWLWRVFRSRVMDHYRRSANEAVSKGGSTAQRLFLDLPEDLGPDDAPDQQQEQRETLVRSILALKDLFDANVWQSFWRVEINGESPKDIANDLGISTWAVYKAKSRCKKRLQAELETLNIKYV